jgi:carbon-monoxide dehydrogenase medium subunit
MRYEQADTVESACEALRQGASILAGGTDVALMRASGNVASDWVVDLKGIAALRQSAQVTQGYEVGALTTLKSLQGFELPRELAGLQDASALVGAPQTRARATLGGNICRSSPSGDTLPSLLALEAEFTAMSTRGQRRVSAADFFTGPGTNALFHDELLTVITIPVRRGSSAYGRVTYRAAMDLAVVGVAVRLTVEDGNCVEACIALGGVAPTPILAPEASRALVGPLDDGSLAATAASIAVQECAPIDDVRGSAEYRRHAVRILTRRMVMLAAERERRTG